MFDVSDDTNGTFRRVEVLTGPGRRRRWSVDGVIVDAIARHVGLSGQDIEHMYQLMAIANYEDRFVIPSAHREIAEDTFQIRGSAGRGPKRRRDLF
jgi:nitrate reductase beta subunit